MGRTRDAGWAGGAALLTLAAAGAPSTAAYADSSACHAWWAEADAEAPTAPWVAPDHGCINQSLEWLQTIHPDAAQAVVVGESVEGRFIYALRLTSDPESAASWSRPTMLVTAGVHGTEDVPPRLVLEWADWLLENPLAAGDPDDDFSNQDLLDAAQIWILPVVNPDSYLDAYRCNARDIDLNRDFPLTWVRSAFGEERSDPGDCAGTTDNGSDPPHPLSQPESRAVSGLAEWLRPSVFVDAHGYRTPITGARCSLGSSRAVATASDNWDVVLGHEAFGWTYTDDSDGDGFADAWEYSRTGSTQTLGSDALHLTWRGTASTPHHDGLPELTEFLGLAHSRRYGPYERTSSCWGLGTEYALDTRSDSSRGSARGPYRGEARGYMWARHGAVSVLLEVLAEKVDPSAPWAFLDADSDGVADQWFASDEPEHSVSDALADYRYPLNQLARIVENPVPGPSLGSTTPRSNLAVTGVRSMSGTCDLTRTWWPDRGRYGTPMQARNGLHGQHDLECEVTNWGDAWSAGFQVDVVTTNLDTATSSTSTTSFSSGIAAGDVVTATGGASFSKGGRYRVECLIATTSGAESDPHQLVVTDDWGCSYLDSAGVELPPECSSATGYAGFESSYSTNNALRLDVNAVLDIEAACPDGKWLPTNANGWPVGHIPAVVSM